MTIVVAGTISGLGCFGTGGVDDGFGGVTPSTKVLGSADLRGHVGSLAQCPSRPQLTHFLIAPTCFGGCFNLGPICIDGGVFRGIGAGFLGGDFGGRINTFAQGSGLHFAIC